MSLRHIEAQPTIRQSHWERVSLPGGQLSVARSLPPHFFDFGYFLTQFQPWQKKGQSLSSGRRVEHFSAPGYEFVLKGYDHTGQDIADWVSEKDRQSQLCDHYQVQKRIFRNRSTPSKQFQLVEEAKRRFRNQFGEELPVEEMLAFYIDQQTTKKYALFPYYEAIKTGNLDDQTYQVVINQVKDLRKKLGSVDVDPAEMQNFLVQRTRSISKYQIMLIDTENWRVD